MTRIIDRRTYTPEDHDKLPLLSFLIRWNDDRAAVMRLVKPNDPSLYHPDNLTPGNRLLYYFWRRFDGRDEAVKKLGLGSGIRQWTHIVKPGDPGFELLDAFKIACDHRRGLPMKPDLLCRALGLGP